MQPPESKEPEYRRDPVTGHWVIVASERARRPGRIESPHVPFASLGPCPFCEGHESSTPPEVLAYRDEGPANGPGWSVRVVPNRYPAVVERPDSQPAAPDESESLEHRRSGHGRHEIVIERPDHAPSLAGASAKQVGLVVRAYRDRLRAISEIPGIGYGLLFKNSGSAAGASQEHVHSQILATRHVPPLVRADLDGAAKYHASHGRSVFADLWEWEVRRETRVVRQTENFLAWCPYASRFPFELWIVPRRAEAEFSRTPEPELEEFAELLRDFLDRMESLFEHPAYNYFLYQGAWSEKPIGYRWRLVLAPRSLGLAGFELAGGTFLNPAPPEWAACRWRESARSSPTG